MPYELLEAMASLWRTERPQALRFSTTQGALLLVMDLEQFHLLSENPMAESGWICDTISVNLAEVSKELLRDVMSNLDVWTEVMEQNKVNYNTATGAKIPPNKRLFHSCDRLHTQMEWAGVDRQPSKYNL